MNLQDNRLAISVKYQCTKKQIVDDMDVYQLPLKRQSTLASPIIRRFSFGEPDGLTDKTASKTILLMGVAGSGKTMWINAMVNYVLGVEWDDPFRFMLVVEDPRGSQAHSRTQEVTIYDLH